MKIYRPPIQPKTYALLVHLAAEMEIRPSELLDKLIKDAWHHRDETGEKSAGHDDKLPNMPHDSRRHNLANSPEELARIRELHDRLSVGQIAKEIDRPKSTVGLAIKRMREKGELG